MVEIKYTDVNDPLTLYYKNDIDPTVHLIRFQTCKDKISLVSPTYSLSGFDYLAQSIDLNQLSNVITALVPPVSVCQVRSYKVLNVTAVSQGTMIADGLKVSGNQLLVAQGIVGVYSFVIEVKLDNSLMTSTI